MIVYQSIGSDENILLRQSQQFVFFFSNGMDKKENRVKWNGKYQITSPLMKVKEESEKVSLKLNIQKTKIMASGPITSWQIDGETVETVPDFIFWGSKITADGDCSHEIKRCLLHGRKVMTNLDSRDNTLPTKVCLVKGMVSPLLPWK